MFAARIAGSLLVLLTVACAGPQRPPSGEPAQTGVTPSGTVAVEARSPPASPPATHSRPPEKALPPPGPTEPVQKKESAAQGPAKQEKKPETKQEARQETKPETKPPLDLKSLESRLKETNAIGFFTKIGLKNQVDDLLDQFRAFYEGRLKTTLAELRRPYDRLLLKVLALLQDTDPPLASAIVASREAIWGILADPTSFATI